MGLSKQQKVELNRAFRSSERFTLGTYASLVMFLRSLQTLSQVIESQIAQLERDEKCVSQVESEDLCLRHFILLDIVSKLMMLSEALLSICFTLTSEDAKRDVPLAFTRYESGEVDKFSRELLSHDHEADLPKMRNILALPLVDTFDATSADTELIEEIFDTYSREHLAALKSIAQFCNEYKIAYNKLKHGLPIMAGAKLTDSPSEHLPSVAYIFDRRENPPPGRYVKLSSKTLVPDLAWFNTIVVVPYDEGTGRRLKKILETIKGLSWVVVNNQLLWAENCGQNFFPVELQDGKPIFHVPIPESLDSERKERWFDVIRRHSSDTAFYGSREFRGSFTFGSRALAHLRALFNSGSIAVVYMIDDPRLPLGYSEIAVS